MPAICICTCQQLCLGINSFEVRINSTCWKISRGTAHKTKTEHEVRKPLKKKKKKSSTIFCFSLNTFVTTQDKELVAGIWGQRDREKCICSSEKFFNSEQMSLLQCNWKSFTDLQETAVKKKVISAFTLCFTVLRYEGIHRGQLALVQVNNTVLCYHKNGSIS